jgi:hypothetical protein
MKTRFQQLYIPLIVLFGLVNAGCFLFSDSLKLKQIDPIMVAGANTLLFVICSIGLRTQIKSVNNSNPHAMVRSVMGSVVLKLFVLGTAAFIYLYNVGEAQSVNGIFLSMGLYILYTWLEVKMAMKIKPTKKDGSN